MKWNAKEGQIVIYNSSSLFAEGIIMDSKMKDNIKKYTIVNWKDFTNNKGKRFAMNKDIFTEEYLYDNCVLCNQYSHFLNIENLYGFLQQYKEIKFLGLQQEGNIHTTFLHPIIMGDSAFFQVDDKFLEIFMLPQWQDSEDNICKYIWINQVDKIDELHLSDNHFYLHKDYDKVCNIIDLNLKQKDYVAGFTEKSDYSDGVAFCIEGELHMFVFKKKTYNGTPYDGLNSQEYFLNLLISVDKFKAIFN